MTHLFIINPAAGSRDRTAEFCRQIRSACEEKHLEFKIEVSTAPGECCRIAREAARTGEELRIYACGGDGTLNEVVNGVAGFSNVAITHFAAGSGNDFDRVFSEPGAFLDLDRLLDNEEAEFDLIRCNEDFALNIVSVGFDARIGTDVGRYKRLPFLSGFRAYAVSALVNTIRGISEHYRVEINGQCFDAEQTLICVCNGRFYGGGFMPIPEADPSDGELDVLLVDKVSRLKVARVIGQYKNGEHAKYSDKIHYFRTKHLRIICDSPTPINLDGELRRNDVVDISLAPEKLRFFYPRGLSCHPVQKAK